MNDEPVTQDTLRMLFDWATGNCRPYYADGRVQVLLNALEKYLNQKEA